MGWLRVGMSVDIDNWVVIIVVMVRVISWVGVDGFVVVSDGLMVDWLNFMSLVTFHVV